MERRPRIPAGRVVADAAVSFLRSQQDLVDHGLRHAGDKQAVDDVVRRHTAAAEAWVSTLAAVEQHAPEYVTEQVSSLYSFHGRVVRGLAEEASLRGDGAIEVGVRRILADQLAQLTDEAVTALDRLPDT